MDNNTISLMISIIAMLISAFTFVLWSKDRSGNKKETGNTDYTSRPLQLQAYERLVLLADRISIPNIVSRANQNFSGTSQEMRSLLIESIKQEYEYNASQQIYVSPVAWEAINNLKEQNILLINKVSASLPAGATGLDLNKILLDVIMNQQKGQLHTIVLEALNYEARKLMK
jgi:hypothetical protein